MYLYGHGTTKARATDAQAFGNIATELERTAAALRVRMEATSFIPRTTTA
jgi:hypothetical protein